MKLKDLIALLKKTKNKPYVLESSENGGKVVVAPSLVGRVMGSSLPYARNNVLGWINKPMIEKGMKDPVFDNVGGEERFWLSPEAGQFGLNFGKNLNGWPNYKVQDALSKQPFKVLSADKKSITMRSNMKLKNASGTDFQVDILRTIRAMNSCPYSSGYGDKIKFVGFETDSTIKNINTLIKRETGPLGIWCLGQFLAKPKSVVIVPFKPSSNKKPIREDYFKDFCINGRLAKNAWTVKKNFALFKADGSHRTKIGVGPKEALPYLAGIDLDSYELIIVDYDFYPAMEYAASYWRKLNKPYDGDAICVAIDGPEKPGGPKGLSYELETLSPALFLQPGESFAFRNRTFHIFGPVNIIDNICQKFLGANIKTIRQFEKTSRM